MCRKLKSYIISNLFLEPTSTKQSVLLKETHMASKPWVTIRARRVNHSATPSTKLFTFIYTFYMLFFSEKADICVGEKGFIRHPYFCDLIVECSSSVDGQIIGVPEGCKENECYKDANFCVECSTIGGCNITSENYTFHVCY